MPKNRIIYIGLIVFVASALLWIGAELTKRIDWLLPYTAGAGAGALLIVFGFLQETWKSRSLKPPA
ncbi:MAG: hypothetical protein DKINENOH_00244 [bacterium]|nr:hypothetical protein [bacterium]